MTVRNNDDIPGLFALFTVLMSGHERGISEQIIERQRNTSVPFSEHL